MDLAKFVAEERPHWMALEAMLHKLESDPARVLSLEDVKRLHHLYQRASADLAKIMTFAAEPEIRRYLESLVARAYGEIHETRRRPHRLAPLVWFFRTFPQTFRRHLWAFWLSLAVTFGGGVFGGLALSLDPAAKRVLMPFEQLRGDPADRVAREEKAREDRLAGAKTAFSSFLMVNNIKVSIT
ncbi:MAG: stage II sporulation protein M, partial [Verrucomicrobiae bacterium]|nr:stage II sporulation protein M [Verrucomicrobiae bacterium]